MASENDTVSGVLMVRSSPRLPCAIPNPWQDDAVTPSDKSRATTSVPFRLDEDLMRMLQVLWHLKGVTVQEALRTYATATLMGELDYHDVQGRVARNTDARAAIADNLVREFAAALNRLPEDLVSSSSARSPRRTLSPEQIAAALTELLADRVVDTHRDRGAKNDGASD